MSELNQMQVIATYGLTEEELEMLGKCGLSVDLLVYDDWTGLVMEPSDLTIINPQVDAGESMGQLAVLYREMDAVDERVILTCKHKDFKRLSFVEVCEGLFEDQKKLALKVISKLKETKRNVDFSRRISIAMRILHLICTKPGITTKELAADLEISERSARRYARSLQAATFAIDYENKGWRCYMNPCEMAWITEKWHAEEK